MENQISLVEKSVTIKVFYEIKNSEMFGGIGSVGYATTEHGGILLENLEKLTDDILKRTCADIAKALKVAPENVRLISKEEYDLNVADEENEEDD